MTFRSCNDFLPISNMSNIFCAWAPFPFEIYFLGSENTCYEYKTPSGYDAAFISPLNIYTHNTGLVPGGTGGYYARWARGHYTIQSYVLWQESLINQGLML